MKELLLKSDLDGITRRDFLKLTSAGLASFFTSPSAGHQPSDASISDFELPCQGRVLADRITVQVEPTSEARSSGTVLRDQVIQINRATLGEDPTAYNRAWYEVEGGGFIHSRHIQPMKVQQNPVVRNLPAKGLPAEVTIPAADTFWGIRPGDPFAYRLYYGAVVWVDRTLEDSQGQVWYRIFDEGDGPIYYFGRAEQFHLGTAEELAPLSSEILPSQKRIEVRLTEQVVIAYENNVPVMMTRAATGAVLGAKDLRTPIGRYFTNYKFPSRHMVHSDYLEENAYDLPGVPWVIFLTTNGVAFHGTYWHNDYGKPRSHGCINLNLAAARWLFRWSVPGVPLNERTILTREGTIVDIF